MKVSYFRKGYQKIFFPMILSFVLLFSVIMPVNAQDQPSGSDVIPKSDIMSLINSYSESELQQNPHMRQYLSELRDYVNSRKEITNDEYESFKNRESYTNAVETQLQIKSQKEQNSLKISSADEEQFKRIDALAQKMYEYYKLHGVIPDLNQLHGSNLFSTSSFTTMSSVSVLAALGITHTEASLAARLVTLGGIAALDGPLPVLDFIALVSGTFIVGAHVYKYIAAVPRTAIPSNIGANEGAQFAPIVITALNIIEIVETARNNGWEHFLQKGILDRAGGSLFTIKSQVGVQSKERANTAILSAYP